MKYGHLRCKPGWSKNSSAFEKSSRHLHRNLAIFCHKVDMGNIVFCSHTNSSCLKTIHIISMDFIITTKEVNGKWADPEIADFSGRYFDFEPHVTPDGNRLIFGSNRPLPGSEKAVGFPLWGTKERVMSPLEVGFCVSG